MLAEMIYIKVQNLMRKAKSCDPFEIADSLGIMVRYSSDFQKICGIYTIIKRKRIVILNQSLPEYKQKIVLAHELGHDMLHRDLAKNMALQDFMFYDMTQRPEYEANLFASELLLCDDDIIECINFYNYDITMTAKKLNTDINLLGLKVESMKKRGYKVDCDLESKNNYL